jgi:hypothetical protein
MRRTLLLLTFAVPLIINAFPAEAGNRENKARGTVMSTDGIALTIDAAGAPMTFAVDERTRVEARGAGTATRRAQSQGRRGPALTEIITAGHVVEVDYRETNGVMHALVIRRVR